jgi:hypothetical protein
VYANPTVDTSEGLSTEKSGDSRSHHWHLVVDGNFTYHLTHNAGKSKINPRKDASTRIWTLVGSAPPDPLFQLYTIFSSSRCEWRTIWLRCFFFTRHAILFYFILQIYWRPITEPYGSSFFILPEPYSSFVSSVPRFVFKLNNASNVFFGK